LLEGGAASVEAVGQELDGEVVVGPAAVDLVAEVIDVRARERQAVRAQEAQEAGLELAERDVCDHRGEQLLRAVLVRVARDAGLHVPGSGAMVHPRLVAGARQVLRGQPRREVEQRARHGHDRDAVQLGDIALRDVAHAVDDDAGPAAVRRRRNGDLGRRRNAALQLQQVRARRVAEPRPPATRQHGGDVIGKRRRRDVPHGVHPAVHAVQQPVLQPALRARLVDTGRTQLARRDPPVLLRGNSRDRGEKFSHIGT
jgi:hypothetical protein